jgi:arylamine N-acetyltransferase
VERSQLGPTDRASSYLRIPVPTSDRVYKPNTAQRICESKRNTKIVNSIQSWKYWVLKKGEGQWQIHSSCVSLIELRKINCFCYKNWTTHTHTNSHTLKHTQAKTQKHTHTQTHTKNTHARTHTHSAGKIYNSEY